MYKETFIGKTIAYWTILEATDRRSKAGCVVFKCRNNETKQIEYRSSAYINQFVRRNSKKTTRGRNLESVKINLSDLESFVNNLKIVCPKLVDSIDEKTVKTPDAVRKLFAKAKRLANSASR